MRYKVNQGNRQRENFAVAWEGNKICACDPIVHMIAPISFGERKKKIYNDRSVTSQHGPALKPMLALASQRAFYYFSEQWFFIENNLFTSS